MRSVVLGIVAAVGLATPALAESISIRGYTCTGWGAANCSPTTVTGTLLATNKKSPLVVLVHGSNGVASEIQEEADKLYKDGYAILYMDHFTPRGVSKSHFDYTAAVAKGANLRSVSLDVLSAIAQLSSDPRVDTSKTAVVGSSQGSIVGYWLGSTSFLKAHSSLLGTVIMPKVVIGQYGCPTEFDERNPNNGLPYKLLMGDKDDQLARCTSFTNLLAGKGGNVTMTVLPGAYHAFDAPYYMQNFGANQGTAKCFVVIHQDGSSDNPLTNNHYSKNDFAQQMKDCVSHGEIAGNNGDRWIGYAPMLAIIRQYTR